MSEEKRFTNKKLIVVSIALVLVCGLSGVLGFMLISTNNDYNNLSRDYDDQYIDHLELLNDFNDLNNQYFILTGEHIELENDYNDLLDEYNKLQNSYDAICLVIKQSILPVQYCIFAEAVRRYYMPIYLGGSTPKEWYMGYTELCRDMILHDSGQYNSFSTVSNAFSDALRFGNDTMNLAFRVMYEEFWDWLPNWDGWGLTGNELVDIDTIVDWCIDEIDYEYDWIITYNQENQTWDYPKFPVETAFRTMGDCEDQAILTATYLESCGFETAIVVFHDPYHPTLGDFYHCVPLVHIEDTSGFLDLYGYGNLWRFTNDPYYPNYTWSWLDTTWDVPFGSTPSWLDDYGGSISFSYCSIAFCDIDGTIGENLGLTCVMPT